jgi:hypothetical protein
MLTYKIQGEVVMEFGPDGSRPVDPQQADYLSWLAGGGVPEELPPLPVPTPEQKAAVSRAAINARRDQIEFGIFTDTHGHRYDVDERSRARLTGAVVMSAAIPPEGIVWTDADNLPRTHTQATLLALAGEILLWTDALHQHASYLKGKLERGEEYDVETGWPA